MEVSFFLALAGGLVLWATRRSGASIFAPWSLYALGQFLTLAVAYLKLDPQMTDFSATTWVVWGGSAAGFLLGCGAATLIPAPVAGPGKSLERLRATWCWIWGIFGLFLFGTAMGLLEVGTWPLLARKPEMARMAFQQTAFSTGLLQFANWALLAALPLLAIRSKGWRRWLLCWIFLVSFSYGLMTGFRLVLIYGLFSGLVTWDLLVRRISIWKLMMTMIAFLLLSTVLLFLRIGGAQTHQGDLLNFGGQLALKGAYAYIANNYWNLDFAIARQLGDHPHPATWGGLFFQPPLMILRIAQKIEPAYGWDTWRNDQSVKNAALNTISYQWSLIKEWGWPGVVLFPFGLGALATRLYLQIERFNSQWAMLLYVPIGFSILFSFFLYMYQTPMYWMIWVCFLGLWLSTRAEGEPT